MQLLHCGTSFRRWSRKKVEIFASRQQLFWHHAHVDIICLLAVLDKTAHDVSALRQDFTNFKQHEVCISGHLLKMEV